MSTILLCKQADHEILRSAEVEFTGLWSPADVRSGQVLILQCRSVHMLSPAGGLKVTALSAIFLSQVFLTPLTVSGVQDLEKFSWDYSDVLSAARHDRIQFSDLPGFTRSVYQRDHALITPESRVWAGQPGWVNATTAHLISPTAATGASFVMYMANLEAEGSAAPPPAGFERFVFVLDGVLEVEAGGKNMRQLHADMYLYLPPGAPNKLSSTSGAGLLLFERRYALGEAARKRAQAVSGSVDSQPVLPVPGEVFLLRKLLPATPDYDFNIHVMDFAPGQFLNVKEVHYNQHGLLLLAGQGIYRLADSWYPVQAGDAIWMAPYVVQWAAFLGEQPARYILYKDTSVDPGMY